jgi:hypothetical protein
VKNAINNFTEDHAKVMAEVSAAAIAKAARINFERQAR